MRFLFRKLIRRRRRRIPASRNLAEGDVILHRGGSYALRIIHDPNEQQGCKIHNAFLDVNLHEADLSPTARIETARLEIHLWQKREARNIFRERTDYWADVIGVKYRKLMPSNPRRQWGSCSFHNDIRINWRLIRTAPELLDYVIVHELCHVTHKNHSKRFWNQVASVMPDWKTRRIQLRQHDPAANI